MTVATKLPRGYLDSDCADYPLDVQRAVYKATKEIADYFMGSESAKIAIASFHPVTPVEWIAAIKRVTCRCERCSGSGTYSWGACINGRMQHSAPCARCGGKGWMDFDDMRRSKAYDNYAICRAVRGDAY